MKKLIISLFALSSLGVLSAQNTFSIKGELKNLSDNAIQLRYATPEGRFIDTIRLNEGRLDYISANAIEGITRLTMVYIGQERALLPYAYLFVDKGGVLTLSGDVLDLTTLEVSGGPFDADLKKLRDQKSPIYRAALRLDRWLNDSKSLLNADFIATVDKETSRMVASLDSLDEAFIDGNPGSMYAAVILSDNLLGADLAVLEGRFQKMTAEVQASQYGQQISKYIEGAKKVAPGAEAANFTQKGRDGKTITLKKYKGSYVLLDFWGSWCGPCRQSHPHLTALYEKYQGEKIQFIGLASDKNRESWEKAIVDDKLTWPHINLFDKYKGEDVAPLYNVRAFPTKVFIDPQGKIIGVIIGAGEEENARLDAMLKTAFGR